MKSFSYDAYFVKPAIHVFKMCKFHFVNNDYEVNVHFMKKFNCSKWM